MDPLADVADVVAIWRALSSAETEVAIARIMQASRMLRRRVQQVTGSSLETLLAGGTFTSEDVADVVAEMVFRAMTQPGFVRQESVTVDDGSRSRTFDASVSGRGAMFATDEEITGLVGDWSRNDSGAFTVVPGDPVWT